jgi:hypothetical protein
VNPPFISLENSDGMILNSPGPIVEVGSALQFDVDALHIKGILTSGNAFPSQELVGNVVEYVFTDFTGTITNYPGPANAQNHVGDSSPALLGENTMSCLITYEAGVGFYFWQDNTRSLAFEQDRLGAAPTVDQIVLAEYQAFYGSGALGSAPTTPAGIRALSSEFIDQVDGAEFQMTVPIGDVEMYFYIPDIYTLDTVFHNRHSSVYVGIDFTQTPIAMEDGGAVPIGYTEFKLVIGGIGFLEEETFIININA